MRLQGIRSCNQAILQPGNHARRPVTESCMSNGAELIYVRRALCGRTGGPQREVGRLLNRFRCRERQLYTRETRLGALLSFIPVTESATGWLPR